MTARKKMPMPTLSKTVVAWSLLHQIVSRSNVKLTALMTHPGGAQYTYLTVARENEGKLSDLYSYFGVAE